MSRSSPALLVDEARALNPVWTFSVEHGRPFVTWKLATSLDGRSAAADGTSRWISNAAVATRHPRAARPATWCWPAPARCWPTTPASPCATRTTPTCPGRGSRCAPSWGCATCPTTGACSTTPPRPSTSAPATPAWRWPTCTPAAATTSSSRAGPTWPAAFLEAGLVDEVIAYVAPVLVGGGTHAVEGLDVPTLAAAHRLDVVDVTVLGDGPERDVRLRMAPGRRRADSRARHADSRSSGTDQHRHRHRAAAEGGLRPCSPASSRSSAPSPP